MENSAGAVTAIDAHSTIQVFREESLPQTEPQPAELARYICVKLRNRLVESRTGSPKENENENAQLDRYLVFDPVLSFIWTLGLWPGAPKHHPGIARPRRRHLYVDWQIRALLQ